MNTSKAVGQQIRLFLSRPLFNTQFKRHETLVAILFLLPALLHFGIFKYYPIGYSFALSLHRGRLLDPFDRYLGGYHYNFILQDDYFWQGVVNSLVYSFGRVPVGAAISLGAGPVTGSEFSWTVVFSVLPGMYRSLSRPSPRCRFLSGCIIRNMVC